MNAIRRAICFSSQSLATGPTLVPLIMQDTAGTRASIQAGVDAITAMLPAANDVKRVAGARSICRSACKCGGGLMAFRASPQPGASALQWTFCAPRRHRDPVGDARNLWRRAYADASRDDAAGRAETAGSPCMVEANICAARAGK